MKEWNVNILWKMGKKRQGTGAAVWVTLAVAVAFVCLIALCSDLGNYVCNVIRQWLWIR